MPRPPLRTYRFVIVAAALVWLTSFAADPRGGAADHAQAGPAPSVAVQLSPAQRQGGSTSVLRLPPAQLRALVFLCHRAGGTTANFDAGAGHSVLGPVKEEPLSPAEQKAFDQQWAAAVAASLTLMTPEQATAAGYVQAAPFNAGVGAHWIKWSLVGRPFDPAHPSMLLFDGIPGRVVRLVGFSYWVKSQAPPVGFAGPNDRWHRHAGLCFSGDGWLGDQHVPSQSQCNGYWLGGNDLWMLHAWVVPSAPNQWGRFAPTNPYLCPRTSRDILAC